MRFKNLAVAWLAVHTLMACAEPALEDDAAPPPTDWTAAAKLIDVPVVLPDVDESDEDFEGVELVIGPHLAAIWQAEWHPRERDVLVPPPPPVEDTLGSPDWEPTIATIFIAFPGESRVGLCTGTMIGADAVLAPAHCVYDDNLGGWASTVRVAPGIHPDAARPPVAPFGSSAGLRLFVPAGYRYGDDASAREAHDYAVIRVADNLGTRTGSRRVDSQQLRLLGVRTPGDQVYRNIRSWAATPRTW
jgi:hypothetical protein